MKVVAGESDNELWICWQGPPADPPEKRIQCAEVRRQDRWEVGEIEDEGDVSLGILPFDERDYAHNNPGVAFPALGKICAAWGDDLSDSGSCAERPGNHGPRQYSQQRCFPEG